MLFAEFYRSPFGPGLVLYRNERIVRHIWGVSRREHPAASGGDFAAALREALEGYFSGRRVDLAGWPVDLTAMSDFERAVYRTARLIKPGRTASYGEVAAAAGRPGAARAVGAALSRNPVPLFVPCHRVVGATGPGGWTGPAGLKEKLLALEKQGSSDRPARSRQTAGAVWPSKALAAPQAEVEGNSVFNK